LKKEIEDERDVFGIGIGTEIKKETISSDTINISSF
jgi:hypothetical protein